MKSMRLRRKVTNTANRPTLYLPSEVVERLDISIGDHVYFTVDEEGDGDSFTVEVERD